MLNKIITRVFLVAIVATFAGCSGYKYGSIAHPQIKSISIAPVRNDSFEPMLATYLRKALAEQFQFDNSFKVYPYSDSANPADCIIFAKMTESKVTSIGTDSDDDEDTYQPAKWTVSVSGEFEIIIPGEATPVFAKRMVTASATYQVYAGNRITKRRGLQQACRNLAKQIVSYTTEAW